MQNSIATKLPQPIYTQAPKVEAWLFYGTGWQRCEVIRLTPTQIDYWYSRHSEYTASPTSGFTVNSVYFFPVGVSPTQAGSRLCRAVQLALL